MKQLKLPFNTKKLEIGDKVKIIGKTVGDPLPSCGWNLGDVSTVISKSIYRGRTTYFLDRTNIGDRVEEHYGRFNQEDLRIVP